MRLETALSEASYAGTAEHFRAAVVELFQAAYPGWSDESLLHHPAEAQHFCDAVRCRSRIRCDDELTLRTLTNTRKRQVQKAAVRAPPTHP